jgi:ribosomal protein L7/L12
LEKKYYMETIQILSDLGIDDFRTIAIELAKQDPEMFVTLYSDIVGKGAELSLLDAGERRLDVIKAIRQVYKIGLKEAKELTEDLPKLLPVTPQHIDLFAAADILQRAGAKIDIQRERGGDGD